MKATLQPTGSVSAQLGSLTVGGAIVAREVVGRVAPATPTATLVAVGGVTATLKPVADRAVS